MATRRCWQLPLQHAFTLSLQWVQTDVNLAIRVASHGSDRKWIRATGKRDGKAHVLPLLLWRARVSMKLTWDGLVRFPGSCTRSCLKLARVSRTEWRSRRTLDRTPRPGEFFLAGMHPSRQVPSEQPANSFESFGQLLLNLQEMSHRYDSMTENQMPEDIMCPILVTCCPKDLKEYFDVSSEDFVCSDLRVKANTWMERKCDQQSKNLQQLESHIHQGPTSMEMGTAQWRQEEWEDHASQDSQDWDGYPDASHQSCMWHENQLSEEMSFVSRWKDKDEDDDKSKDKNDDKDKDILSHDLMFFFHRIVWFFKHRLKIYVSFQSQSHFYTVSISLCLLNILFSAIISDTYRSYPHLSDQIIPVCFPLLKVFHHSRTWSSWKSWRCSCKSISIFCQWQRIRLKSYSFSIVSRFQRNDSLNFTFRWWFINTIVFLIGNYYSVRKYCLKI